jgi:hypothetical protein
MVNSWVMMITLNQNNINEINPNKNKINNVNYKITKDAVLIR